MRTIRFVFLLIFLAGLPLSASLPAHAQSNDVAANKALVGRYGEELYSQHKLDIASEIFTEDAIFHQPGSADLNLTDLLKSYEDTFAAFPDARIGTLYVRIAEDNYVASAYSWEGTFAPTGTKVQFNVVNLCRIENGKIAEVWHVWDSFNVMQQVGAIPVQGELPSFTPWSLQLGTSSSSPQENKAIVELNFRSWPKTLDVTTVAMDMMVHLPLTFGPDPQPDFGGNALWTKQYQMSYPEFALTGPDGEGDYVMVAEGDLVAILYSSQFHFTQDVAGLAANGTLVKAPGLSIVRIKDGQEAEFWVNVDTASLIMQMSAPPTNE